MQQTETVGGTLCDSFGGCEWAWRLWNFQREGSYCWTMPMDFYVFLNADEGTPVSHQMTDFMTHAMSNGPEE